MTHTNISTRPHTSYRHEAMLCSGIDGFLAGTLPFIREGLAAGQPVMVAAIGPRLDRVRAELGPAADEVALVDMAELGHNPARIIPAWNRFVDQCDGRPVRGVGEPLWAGRRAPEVEECQLHEALLNVAVDPDTPLWLLCPYDVDALDPQFIDEARRSHPALVCSGDYQGSTNYGGVHHAGELFARDLADPMEPVTSILFGLADLSSLRALVTSFATDAGLAWDRCVDLALVAHELAVNSIRHGGGHGTLRLWRDAGSVVCEVRDGGVVSDPLAGRRSPGTADTSGRGLWLANQLCDLVQLRSGPSGTVLRTHSWLPAA